MMYLGQDAVGINHMVTAIGTVIRTENGIYIPKTDESVVNVILNHSLGVIPDFITVFTDSITIEASPSASYFLFGSCYPSYFSSDKYLYSIGYSQISTGYSGASMGPIDKTAIATITTFSFPQTTNTTDNKSKILKANTAYYYIIGKYNTQEVTPNA